MMQVNLLEEKGFLSMFSVLPLIVESLCESPGGSSDKAEKLSSREPSNLIKTAPPPRCWCRRDFEMRAARRNRDISFLKAAVHHLSLSREHSPAHACAAGVLSELRHHYF